MSGQYQERKKYFKHYTEKKTERLQQRERACCFVVLNTTKIYDYYEENKDKIKEHAKHILKECAGNKQPP